MTTEIDVPGALERIPVSRDALVVVIATVALLGLASCAAGPNPAVDVSAVDGGTVAGFWFGLWHGIIAPITFIVSLFTESVSLYEVHNTGGWYDFGFVLGASASLGGSGRASGRRRRRSRRD